MSKASLGVGVCATESVAQIKDDDLGATWGAIVESTHLRGVASGEPALSRAIDHARIWSLRSDSFRDRSKSELAAECWLPELEAQRAAPL